MSIDWIEVPDFILTFNNNNYNLLIVNADDWEFNNDVIDILRDELNDYIFSKSITPELKNSMEIIVRSWFTRCAINKTIKKKTKLS